MGMFSTKRSLLSKIKNGNEVSWEEFYKTYAPLIVLCGRDFNLSPEDINELIQTTVLAIFKDKNFKYQPEKGRFRDYLRTVIKHKAIDIKRKRKREKGNLSMEELCWEPEDKNARILEQKWEDEWRKHVFRQAIQELKNSMSPESYQIFDLYVLKGWPSSKVARFLNISENVVYTNKNRAIGRLRKILKDMDEV